MPSPEEQLINNFSHTVDVWIDALSNYRFSQLTIKPSLAEWSLGQVYMHLIENTLYFIEQARVSLSSNDHANDQASRTAKEMFEKNEFPDERIEGPPSNLDTPHPNSRNQILEGFQDIKKEINALGRLLSKSSCRGKTQHPGLQYFCAAEWIQFAEMHLRHHLRQKKRIDDFLKSVQDDIK